MIDLMSLVVNGVSTVERGGVKALTESRSANPQCGEPKFNDHPPLNNKNPGRLTGVSSNPILFDAFIPFCCKQCVVQDHCDGEWTDTAWYRCDIACNFRS